MPAKAKKLPAIESSAKLLETIDDIARLEVSIRAKEAKRDHAIQTVRIEHDVQIEDDKKRLKSLMTLASNFAAANRDTLFAAGMKSAASALARFGFRSGNPTLKVLNNKWTMDDVLVAVKKLGKFFRTVEELDKESIHAAKLSDAELAQIGLRLDSGERFFVESKAEDADRLNHQPEEAATV